MGDIILTHASTLWALLAVLSASAILRQIVLRIQRSRCRYYTRRYFYMEGWEDMPIHRVYESQEAENIAVVEVFTTTFGVVHKQMFHEDKDALYKNIHPTMRAYAPVDVDKIMTVRAYDKIMAEERKNMSFSEEEIEAEQRRLALEEAARRKEAADQQEEYEKHFPSWH